ncbi:MAG: dephospho-CoA kinase [Bifidobacterium sp.]|uniref:Dephospho-CoA kinase n=1 Tax=Bifidobacterium fermentum TaxID=3059035 RepID=A0AB39UQE9_9BIFI
MRIAITGGIAAGKSTVVAHLKELGACVIDYDRLAAEVVAPGSLGLERIISTFGIEAVDDDGRLRRKWLASVVFGGKQHRHMLQRLNAIVHPLVYEQAAILESMLLDSDVNDAAETTPIIVHDIPLLTEVRDSIPFTFRHVITVEAPVGMRVQRMVSTRHMSPEEANARIRSQSSEQQRLAIADIVIDSAVSFEQMFECVDRIYAELLQET